MAFRTWGRLLLTALGVSLLAGAGQLGVAFGFGIVRLTGAFTGATVNQWPAQLVWAGWFAANAAVVGALLTERLARRDGPLTGTGRQLAVVSGAALGATVVAPLCMQPARAAEFVSMDPVWAVGICAILGALAGAGAALAVLLRPPAGWNMAAVAGAVWLLALLSTAPSVASTGPLPSVRLGVLEPAWLDAGAAQRLALVILPLVALLAGAATGGLARWRGHPPLVSGSTGVAGPVLVAFTYVTAGPGDATDRYQLLPYYGALAAVAAGALGSAAAALLRWPLVTPTAPGDAIEPTEVLRPLPAGPALPHTPEPAAEPATVDLADAGRLAADRPPAGTGSGGTADGDAVPPRAAPAHWDWPADGTVPTTPATAAATASVAPASVAPDRAAGSPPPAFTEVAQPAGSPTTTNAARPATPPPPAVTDTPQPTATPAAEEAVPPPGAPAPPVTDTAHPAGSRPATDAAVPAESRTATDAADAGVPAESPAVTPAAGSPPSTATDATGSAESPVATVAAGSPSAATEATRWTGSPPPVAAASAARGDRADEGGQALTAAGEQPPAAAEDAAPAAQPAVPAARKPRRTRKPRSTKQPTASAANRADPTPAATDSPADPPTAPAAPGADARATAAIPAATGTRAAGDDTTTPTGSSAAGPAPTTEAGPTAEVGPTADVGPSTEIRPTTEVSPATEASPTTEIGPTAGADRRAGEAPTAGVGDPIGATSGAGSHVPEPDGSGPRPAPPSPADELATGRGGEPDPALRSAWRPAPAWPAAPRVGPDDAPDTSRPAAAQPTPEPAPRPRHRAPLPDLARAANWDALATARRGGPAPAPVDAAAESATAAAGEPEGPADGEAPDGPAAQPSGRTRGRLGLFRRNRSRAEDAPADRDSEPLPAQDEEYVDWVAGLSRSVADNEPEQEIGRRSLRSTGRHHRD
ncbi:MULTISPECIES: hypothetical protein [unclassified Micromonospora]|uniref:hypothetical protein n=1 Tax=unclassified Micromonospora TaxID=2617518 RepID=UPI003321664F